MCVVCFCERVIEKEREGGRERERERERERACAHKSQERERGRDEECGCMYIHVLYTQVPVANLCFFWHDSVDSKPSLHIVQEAEVLSCFVNGNHI